MQTFLLKIKYYYFFTNLVNVKNEIIFRYLDSNFISQEFFETVENKKGKNVQDKHWSSCDVFSEKITKSKLKNFTELHI